MQSVRSIAVASTGLALAFGSSAALAEHSVVYAPRTEALASSATHQGPNVAGSNSHYVNGVLDSSGSFTSPGGLISGGGSVAQTFAQSSQNGGTNYGDPLHNDAYAAADLANGTLKATTASTGPDNFGSPLGSATARLDETIFFKNSSGHALTVSFTYSFDGVMVNPDAAGGANPGGSVALALSCGGGSTACDNGSGDRITFANGPTRSPEDIWQYFWSTTSSCFGENIYCGQGAAPYFESGLNHPNADGIVDGFISTSFLIPTGETAIGIRGTLNLDCRGASSCDFGHTGLFRFGDLPSGLTFSSASGVFLSDTGPAGVPEPAAWAMMVGGFGLLGATMRRHHRGRHVSA